MFDKAIMEAGEYLTLKEVARYSHGLCVLFNEFYEAVQVNSEPDPLLKAWLALVEGFATTLKDALESYGDPNLREDLTRWAAAALHPILAGRS